MNGVPLALEDALTAIQTMGSSSTTRISSHSFFPSIGSQIVNVLPLPTSLLTRIAPPWRSTMPYETESRARSPAHLLVLKKGSNSFRDIFGGNAASGIGHRRSTPFCPAFSGDDCRRLVRVTLPPGSVASSAFKEYSGARSGSGCCPRSRVECFLPLKFQQDSLDEGLVLTRATVDRTRLWRFNGSG